MAIMNKIIIAAAALAALVSAAPFDARSISTECVTETVWTTMDITLTVWVDKDGNPITTESAGIFAQATTTSSPTTTTSVVSTTTPPARVAQAENTNKNNYAAAVVPSSAPVVQQQQQPAPVPTTAAATTSAAPVAAPVQSDTSASNVVAKAGSSSGTCEGTSNTCSGDITYYEGGLGACGWNVNTGSDMAIALPYEFMGTQSNGNPYCGRKVTIKNPSNGQTVEATVGDKCMGCTGRSIDLTDALFKAVGGGCDGRCSGFDWWFSS